MDAFRGQEVVFLPVVHSCGFVALQAAGDLATEDFGMIAVEFPMQQRRQHRTNLRNGDRRREIFSPVESLG
jgi:hypothetical protein